MGKFVKVTRKCLPYMMAMLLSSVLFGQVPRGFNYQAVVRNTDGTLKTEEQLSVKVFLLQGTADGAIVFDEVHNTQTDAHGLINLTIGMENTTVFAQIDWANGPYFLQVNIDGKKVGVTQLLSVPFAMYALEAGNASGSGENGKSAYEIWLENGNTGTEAEFLESIIGAEGKSAYEIWLENGNTGSAEDFLNALQGLTGQDGTPGRNGASAYELWLASGNTGTLSEFFASLEGSSAYEIWLNLGNTGTEQDFIDSLRATSNGGNGAPGASAYQIWLDAGNTGTEQDFLNSLIGAPGPAGENGTVGMSAYETWIAAGNTGTENDFLNSLVGTTGANGNNGASAYQIWLDLGNSGTEQDFLNSLKGARGTNGASAFELWLASGNTGTLSDFLTSLKGETGAAGPVGTSAYQIWLNQGNTGTEADFLNSLKGQNGADGAIGQEGASAYQIWLNLGNTGTEEDFLNSLVGLNGTDGAIGASAYQIWLDEGNTGTEADFLNSLVGQNGADGTTGAAGASAYQIWLDEGNTGTQADFLNSLVGQNGADGTTGAAGASAYQIWLDEGNTGSETDFIASLQGTSILFNDRYSDTTTWTSSKIGTELDSKADITSLGAVATTNSYSDLDDKPVNLSQFTNDANFITEETDPRFDTSVARGITAADTARWNSNNGGSENPQTIGDLLLNGNNAGGNTITNLGTPTAPFDAATKAYVDNLLIQIGRTDKLLSAGFSSQNLYEGGHSPADLLSANVDTIEVLDLVNSPSEMFFNGIGVKTFYELGLDTAELIARDLMGTVSDAEGNSYDWVRIGTTKWTTQNIRATRYSMDPADTIIFKSSNTEWNLEEWFVRKYAHAYYDINNVDSIGCVYSWAGALDSVFSAGGNVKGVCPEGWHVTTKADWNYLAEVFNGYQPTSAIASTTGWDPSTVVGAPGNDQLNNNAAYLNIFPTGNANKSGFFNPYQEFAEFWCSDVATPTVNPYSATISYNSGSIALNKVDARKGCYVRCVQD